MFRIMLPRICKELSYTVPCSLPGNKEMFDAMPQGRPSEGLITRQLAVCAGCLVRLECLTDAVNSALDLGYLDRSGIAGFTAGKTTNQLSIIAKDFKNTGFEQVTLDQITEHWQTPIIS